MSTHRLRLVIPVLLTLFFAAQSGRALLLCDSVCTCLKPCTTKCTPGPGLPLLTCGQWGYECIGACQGVNALATGATAEEEFFAQLATTSTIASVQDAAAFDQR